MVEYFKGLIGVWLEKKCIRKSLIVSVHVEEQTFTRGGVRPA
jgi:hypothetical protein